MFKYLANKKRLIYWITAPVALLGIFLLVQPAQAGVIEGAVMTLIGWILLPIIHFLGNILLLLIEVLIDIFKFSEFIDSAAVQLGWVIIRDVANIGIVVSLIIIAFSTVFRIKKYAASQLLVKLIIAAFLVNFSLVITGLIIDFGQVLMLYFVNAFSDLAAGNLTVGFGIEQMLQVSKTVAQNPGFDSGDLFSVIGAMILAIVLLIVAIAVIMVFLVVLLQRIIFLWILAIFSPVAWVAPLLPGGDKYSSQWWDNFSKQVFIGPILAFGFWLSMSILAGVSANQSLIALSTKATNKSIIKNTSNVARFVTEVSTPQAILDFMVTIALLVGTLAMAKQAGGVAGSFAGTVAGKLQKGGMAAIKRPFRPATDRFKAYQGKREAVRKGKIDRFATKLSARRDTAPGLGTKKSRTRSIARGQRSLQDLDKADIADATTRYNMGRQSDAQLRATMDGHGEGRGHEAAQQAAAMQLSTRANGFANSGQLNDALNLFQGANLQDLHKNVEDGAKKNSVDAALASNIYRDADGTLTQDGIETLSRDMLNGTMDVRVLNSDDLRAEVNTVAPNGNFVEQLSQGARNGDHLQGMVSRLSNEAKTELTAGLDLTHSGLSLDKRNGLASAGLAPVAFNNPAEGSADEVNMERFLDDKKNFNTMLSNMAADSLDDRGNNHVFRRHVRQRGTRKQLEDLLEDRHNRNALQNGSRADIRDHETNVRATHVVGTPAYENALYADDNIERARATMVKITNNAADGYDMTRTRGRDAFSDAVGRGRIAGGELGHTVVDNTSPQGRINNELLARRLSPNQMADLREANTESAREVIITLRRLAPGDTRMKAKLDSLVRSPRFAGVI